MNAFYVLFETMRSLMLTGLLRRIKFYGRIWLVFQTWPPCEWYHKLFDCRPMSET